jgi:hypothetical protein
MSPQATLTTHLHKDIPDEPEAKEYTITLWVRATGTPASTVEDVYGNKTATVGTVTVGNVVIPITVPAGGEYGNYLGTTEIDRNDRDTHWYLFTATVPLNNMPKGTEIIVTSTMLDPEFSTMDIDNMNINQFKLSNFSFINHANSAHANSSQNTLGGLNTPGNPNNAPQYVHSRKQIVYMRPNDVLPITAATEGMTYYRWYDATPAGSTLPDFRRTDGGYNTQTIYMGLQTGTQPNFATLNQGLFYYNTGGFSGRTGQQINVTVPPDFNAPRYITCDVSNYTDWNLESNEALRVDSATFTEPTLSFRNHFELRPAWEIAREIDSTLYLNP